MRPDYTSKGTCEQVSDEKGFGVDDVPKIHSNTQSPRFVFAPEANYVEFQLEPMYQCSGPLKNIYQNEIAPKRSDFRRIGRVRSLDTHSDYKCRRSVA